MKRAMSVLGILIFFGVLIFGVYYISGGKFISSSDEWAKDKLYKCAENEYDVIVVGSDPEGIAAAISSARSGAKTLLLGFEDGPGGLLTYGMLNTLDMNRNGNVMLSRGIFQEFYKAIGNTESFDVSKAKEIFQSMINAEKNLEYRKSQTFIEPILKDKVIIGVKMEDESQNVYDVFGKRIIDATQDGDVCAASGVPYYIGMEDINLKGNMAATLVFKVGGVNWKELGNDINSYKAQTKDNNCGFNKSTAWGFGKWCYEHYKTNNEDMQLRGPNFGLQEDGTILINALQIFNVDGLDKQSKLKAMEDGKKELENVLRHLKQIIPSFKDAYIAGIADDLYIRETRHIIGEYTLLATDVLGNRNFHDKIAVASYPVDIQATSKSNTGYVTGSPTQYSIPIRCTVPKEIDNLFIVGRSASYSSVAAGSARVVPTGMVVGESVGITAVYTIYKNTTPRELVSDNARIKQLTGILKDQNIYLPEFSYGDPNSNVDGYDKIKKLLNLGMLSGGYSNNYYFDSKASVASLCNAMVNALQRGGSEKYDLATAYKITRYYSTESLTGGAAARILAGFFDLYEEPEGIKSDSNLSMEEYNDRKYEQKIQIEKECYDIVKEAGYFSEDFGVDEKLTYRHACIIAVDAIERYIGHELKFYEK